LERKGKGLSANPPSRPLSFFSQRRMWAQSPPSSFPPRSEKRKTREANQSSHPASCSEQEGGKRRGGGTELEVFGHGKKGTPVAGDRSLRNMSAEKGKEKGERKNPGFGGRGWGGGGGKESPEIELPYGGRKEQGGKRFALPAW